MAKNSKHTAQIPNPALEPLSVLVGEWKTVATHPQLPNTTLHGRSSFKWIEGGAFLLEQSEIDEEGFPVGISIFGSDDATGEYFRLSFDERKVSRKYDVSIRDNVLKWWRNAPNFSQRYTCTIADDGNMIVVKGELSRDGTTWGKDLDLTYTRPSRASVKKEKRRPQGRVDLQTENGVEHTHADNGTRAAFWHCWLVSVNVLAI